MQRCKFRIGVRGHGPPHTVDAYLATPTWVVAKGRTSTVLPWSVYHAATGAYVWPVRTKRAGEWLALALGETEPFDVTASVAWANAHYELEQAEKKLAKAKKEADATT